MVEREHPFLLGQESADPVQVPTITVKDGTQMDYKDLGRGYFDPGASFFSCF